MTIIDTWFNIISSAFFLQFIDILLPFTEVTK